MQLPPNDAAGMAAQAAGQTSFNRMTNRAAMGKLEAELREYVRSLPFRPIPTYNGLPPPRTHVHNKGDPKNINPYSRSADHRYCLQQLAADIHGPHEASRESIPYSTYLQVLSAPEGRQLERLNPRVEEKPKEFDDVLVLDGRQVPAGKKSGKEGSPAAKVEAVQLKMTQGDYEKEMARLQAGQDSGQRASKRRAAVPDMSYFPHAGRGFLVFQHQPATANPSTHGLGLL